MTAVTLSLISHTNVGKTTLARTLLRREIGEVLDKDHVTEVSEAHVLIEDERRTLKLWDTPGFGNIGRLMKRLRRENEPLGWFLHQVWDRVVDRPLWCSQQAVRNVKQEADVVLYLVNAAEEPEDAGYVPPELELLTWMDRPVLLLLNQVGDQAKGLEARWRSFVEPWPVVRGVLSLDAFTHCWVQEGVLFRQVAQLLDGPKRGAMEELARAWSARNLALFQSSCRQMADYLLETAMDRQVAQPATDDGDSASGARALLGEVSRALKFSAIEKKRAMSALNERLDARTVRLMERMIAEHRLVGESAAHIERRIQDFQVDGGVPITERTGALAGAVVSGALGGLAADALSGGLTLGGGVIAGGILGALGGAALGRGYRMVGGGEEPAVRWTTEFLDQLAGQVVLRYLAVAHFGRGRGEYRDLEQPAHWSAAVKKALGPHAGALHDAWKEAERRRAGAEGRLGERLAAILEKVTRAVLRGRYGDVAGS